MKALQDKISAEINKKMFFNQPYLDPEDPKCTASEYFKEISYMIDLGELYKIVDTCYYHAQMKYCPIFLKIGAEKVKKGYGDCEYLIQAWDKSKQKIFEKALKHPIKNWQICFNYLVYTLDQQDDDGQYTYIVDLEKNNTQVKVKNFGIDPLVKYISYCNENLFCATSDEISVCQVPSRLFEGQGNQIDANNLTVRKLTPGLPIHGLILNEYCLNDKFQLVVLESRDNQLDFNRCFLDNFDNNDTFKVRWTQYRELVPRKIAHSEDPIRKCIFTFNSEGYNYSCALRSTGKFDLYWNMMRQESVDNKYALDIEMDSNGYYFKMIDGKIYGFNHKNKFTVSYQQAEEIVPEDLEWGNIPTKKVQNIVYLYTAFKIFSIYSGANAQSFCSISHGKYISIFSIFEWRWTNHLEFQDDVMSMFTHKNAEGALYTSCMTKKGWIYIGFMYDGGNYQQVVQEAWRGALVEGTFIRSVDDLENNNILFILHKHEGKLRLSMLYKAKLENYDHLLTAGEARVGIVSLQIRGKEQSYLLQNGSTIGIYQALEKDGKFQPVLMKSFPEFKQITGTLHSGCAYDIDKHIFLFDEVNMYVIKTTGTVHECTVYENIYCIGIQNFTKSYNYALCQDSPKATKPGLRLFDMESCIKRNKSGMVLLKKIDAGTQGYFEWSFNLIRIGMMKSLTHLAIIPILHRNMNKFMGMAGPVDYISYKVIKDTMLAVTVDGKLFSWSILSGKLIAKKVLADHDYSGYELNSTTYKQGPVILKSKEAVTDVDDADYFQPFQFDTQFENQTVFLKQGYHTYKRWKQVEIVNESEMKVNLEFVHPSYSYQHMFINKDKDRMIELLMNYRTFFYKKEQVPGKPDHVIKWALIRRIVDYPVELQFDQGRIDFFTPCFSRYVIVDKKTKQFVIKDNYVDQVIHKIPKELIGFKDLDKALQNFNRFKWVDNRRFIVANEEGIEKLVDVDEHFKELSYNLRPLFNEVDSKDGIEESREYEKFAYYIRRADLSEEATLPRLMRTYQQYKTSYFLYNKRSNTELYEELITVDPYKFNYNVNSFTFLHWSLIEQICAGKLKIDELEEEVVQQIIYNILPGGNSILHKLADNEDELISIFKTSHPDFDNLKPKYHVPFLPNIKGDTAMHNCIGKQDYKSIDSILKYLKFYPADHHSRGIKNLYSELVQKNLPELPPYLESRFQESKQTSEITKGCLRTDTNGIIPCDLWFKVEDFKTKLMTERPVETRIKCEFLDMPGVYHYLDDEFHQFFEALSKTDNMDYFNLQSIQKLVEFNYEVVREFVIKKLFLPFGLFQLFFFIFMNYIQGAGDSPFVNAFFYPFLIVNVGFATYFLANEIRQLSIEGIPYLLSFWNYIDIIPPIGIYLIAIITAFDQFDYKLNDALRGTILSIITFFMWFKFLYFLRIFSSTGYLIRMIFEVVKDMRNFFLILFITIAAFGDSFLRIAQMNTDEKDIFTSGFTNAMIFTYRMILGDFDTGEFGSVAPGVVMILFLLCTLFNMIVMLNLLIAIISDSYARITNVSLQATYQERATMISENHYLIPDARKKDYAEIGKYLLIVSDLENPKSQLEVDPVVEKIYAVKESLNEQIREIKKYQQDNEKQAKSLQEIQQSHQVQLNDIKGLLKTVICSNYAKVSIHKNPLQLVTFAIQKKRNPAYAGGWFCDGMKQGGCQGNGGHSNTEGLLYHCAQCSYDFCEGCFNHYGNTPHEHPLAHITLGQVQELHPGGYSSFGCDGRHIQSGCPTKGLNQKDDEQVFYHDSIAGFDLCEFCTLKYKIY